MANTNVPTAPGWPGRVSTPTPRRSPVTRRRRLLVLAFSLVVVAIAVMANYGPLQTYRDARERLDQATAAVDSLGAEKATLQSELGGLTEAGYLESLAREKLTYARPGEDVYIVTPPEETSQDAAGSATREKATGGDTLLDAADKPGPLERFPSALSDLF
jgi:cell division protein FtsB